MSKKCPKCKLINPPSAMRCDCGYDFSSGEMKGSYLTAKQMGHSGSLFHPLTGVDIALCFFIPVIALFIGIFRAISRRPGGIQMISVSLAWLGIVLIVRLVIAAVRQ